MSSKSEHRSNPLSMLAMGYHAEKDSLDFYGLRQTLASPQKCSGAGGRRDLFLHIALACSLKPLAARRAKTRGGKTIHRIVLLRPSSPFEQTIPNIKQDVYDIPYFLTSFAVVLHKSRFVAAVDGTCFCTLLSLAHSNRSPLGVQKPGAAKRFTGSFCFALQVPSNKQYQIQSRMSMTSCFIFGAVDGT